MTTTVASTATAPAANTGSRRARRISYAISGVITALLSVDAFVHIANFETVRKASTDLLIPAHLGPVMGIVLALSLVLYTWRPTAVIGAILISGYFGGACTVHLINENPLFTHILFSPAVSVLLWFALYLRDPRVKALVPSLSR